MTTARIPHITSTAYRAAAHLHKTGPLSRADLFAQVQFPSPASHRAQSLNSAIANGWLVETIKSIACSPALAKHFDSLEAPERVHIGQKAGPRTNSAYDRPPLKYFTNSRGTRDDVPAFSVREKMSFATLGGQS